MRRKPNNRRLLEAILLGILPIRTPVFSWAQDRRVTSTSSGESDLLQPYTNLIDIPTAAVADYGNFTTQTRFFSGGGVLEYLSFGVFQRLNLGASLDMDRLVGNSAPINVDRPEIQARLRFYDGDRYLPALAVGYDSQGYFYDRGLKKYMERSRGLYLVGSLEAGLPGLVFHPGINLSDFDSDAVFGFLGAQWTFQEKVAVLAEYDNLRSTGDSRLNLGLRIHVTPFFNMDLGVREVGKGKTFPNGAPEKAERIVQLEYTGNF